MRFLDTYLRSRYSGPELRQVIVDHCLAEYGSGLEAIFLVGSYARRSERADSDVDLLIVIDTSDFRRPYRVRQFGVPPDYQGPELSPVIYTRDEFLSMPPFVYSLLDAHEVLYSRSGDDAAAQLLAGLERHAAERSVSKRPHKGGYYWRRNIR